MSEWKTMTLAPKDRTVIIVTRVPFNGAKAPINMVRWGTGKNLGGPRWRRHGSSKDLAYEPTHWMPLPEPPPE